MKRTCPKKIATLQATGDKELLNRVIVGWKELSKVVPIEKEVQAEMDSLMDVCIHEAGKTYPVKDTVCRAIKDFSRLFHNKVVIEKRIIEKGLLHPDLKAALERFERSLTHDIERSYFAEAKKCIEFHLYRSFIVMSWNIVMYRLYTKIQKAGFEEFARVYESIFKSKITLHGLDDFYDVPDSCAIKASANKSIHPHIIGKEQEIILLSNLKRRNLCAHVSTAPPPRESTVLAFLEEIVDSFLSGT